MVPRLVNFSGRALGVQGKPISGVAGLTFAIYRDQSEGSPLWMETQSVQADGKGNYVAQLGASRPEGLPLDLFTSAEARWLGVRINGGEEQPRVLLVSVPYALKAADAQTLGGLPPSAFMLAKAPVAGAAPASATEDSASASAPPPATSNVTTTGGTVNFLPLWTTATNVQSSAITQTGTGATARIGIGTVTPSAVLDVRGSQTVRGVFTLPATGAATVAAGKNSQSQNFAASAFNSGSSTAVNQTFRWQAEPTGNNTVSPGASLNLLFGQGAAAPAETGFKIAGNGQLTFATGQTFPGVGTVKSVGLSAPSADFNVTGSPVTGSGTLALSWKIAPDSANTPNAIVKRDASGNINAGIVVATNVYATANSGLPTAVTGYGTSTVNGIGVLGSAAAGSGVEGASTSGNGVFGSSQSGYGVTGTSQGSSGVYGMSQVNVGVYGYSPNGGGVYGLGNVAGVDAQGGTYGVYASGSSYGVFATTDGFDALHGVSHLASATALGAVNDAGGDAIFAAATNGGVAGYFGGDVQVSGNLSKAGGSFKIDHPLDPANKYLYHSFVESPDMKNIYDGTVTTDANGQAVVTLPEWFSDLNRDFRYQLTAIGAPGPNLYVAEEISGNHFKIAGAKPGARVSWQVTGIRHDAWANANRIPVEQAKPEKERGFYLHPELFGAPAEKGLALARHPESMKGAKDKPPLPSPLRPAPVSGRR